MLRKWTCRWSGREARDEAKRGYALLNLLGIAPVGRNNVRVGIAMPPRLVCKALGRVEDAVPVNAPYPPPLGVVQNDVAAPGDGVETRGAGGKRPGVSEWQESSPVQIDAWQIGRHLGHRLETMDRAGLPLGVRRHQLPNSRAGKGSLM